MALKNQTIIERIGKNSALQTYVATLTPVAVDTIVAAEQTFSVPGLKVDDIVLSVNGPATSSAVALCSARISAADTLALTYCNPTAGSLTPAAGTFVITILRKGRA